MNHPMFSWRARPIPAQSVPALAVLAVATAVLIGIAPRLAIAAGLPLAFQDKDPQKALQPAVASKTAHFESVLKTDPLYKTALDAHDLDGAKKNVGATGAFKGTVSKIFQERDGDLLILDFDPNYRTALTAVLKKPD